MSLSRRQFFRRLAHPTAKNPQERRARYEEMENYLRTNLLPYDFPLTAEQEKELFTYVRADLEAATDEELFSVVVHFRIEEAADRKIRPWREQYRLNEQ